MKKILYITTAFILCGLAQSQAACIATPNCTTLGYTSTTSCTGGLKCPFGNYWNCDLANKINELEQKIEIMEQESANSGCQIGAIFYSDKTCSIELQSGKTPIGVVVYVDGFGHGQALALDSLDYAYRWGNWLNDKDIPELTNYSSSKGIIDFASCANSKIIMAAGGSAAEAVNEYSTEGTSAGDWCLPAAGVWASYDDNKITIDKGFLRAGVETPSTHCPLWSSTESGYEKALEYDYDAAYTFYGLGSAAKSTSHAIYPVIEF